MSDNIEFFPKQYTIYIVDKEGIPKKAASTMDVRGTLSFLG